MERLAFLLLLAAAVTYGQTSASPKSNSDSEKIASALQAGPEFITRNATVLDWPSFTQGRVPSSPGRQNELDLSSRLS